MAIALAISLALNFFFFAATGYVIQGRGGLAYLRTVLSRDGNNWHDVLMTVHTDQHRAYSRPRHRPVVFFGDSLTQEINWWELLGENRTVLNRGISGDTTYGMLSRLEAVTSLRPVAVFVMGGANDPQMLGFAPNDTAVHIQRIVSGLRQAVPDCKVYVQSILPSRTPKFSNWGKRTNELLRKVKGSEFLDIRPAFEDAEGLLKAPFTFDGLHLTAAGYIAWADQIKNLIRVLPSEGDQ